MSANNRGASRNNRVKVLAVKDVPPPADRTEDDREAAALLPSGASSRPTSQPSSSTNRRSRGASVINRRRGQTPPPAPTTGDVPTNAPNVNHDELCRVVVDEIDEKTGDPIELDVSEAVLEEWEEIENISFAPPDEDLGVSFAKTDDEQKTWKQWAEWMRPAFVLLGFVVFKALYQFLMKPLIPFLMKDYFGSSAKAASVSTIFEASRAFVAMLVVPIYGNLLDTVGRYPFFILAAILGILPPAFLLAIPTNPLWYMFFNELAQVFSATYYIAYIADNYTARNRGRVLAFVEGVASAAALFAPLGANMTKDTLSLVVLTISLIRLPYGLFLIKESLDPSLRKPLNWKLFCVNPLVSIKSLTGNIVLRAVTAMVVCLLVAAVGAADVSAYYFQARVNYTQQDNFYLQMEQGLLTPFIFLVLYPVLSKFMRPSRLTLLAFMGLFGGLLSTVLLFKKWQIFVLITPLSLLTSIATPALLGIFSNAGDQEDQGKRIAGITAVMDLCKAIIPLAIGQLFGALPSDLMWISFAICLVAMVPAIFIAAFKLPGWISADRQAALHRTLTSAGESASSSAINLGRTEEDE